MLERLFKKIFIAIVPLPESYDVMCIGVKNNKVLFKEQRTFEGNVLSKALLRYLEEMVNESPYHYISTLAIGRTQGAYRGCEKPSEYLLSQQVAGLQTLCRNKEWTEYIAADELYTLRSHYDEVGLDFIFSPFSLIEYYFSDKIKNSLTLYAFGTAEFFSVAIFDAGVLEYAHHYPLIKAQDETLNPAMEFSSGNLDKVSETDSLIRLDDIEDLEDLELLDDLDVLSDIADLDDLDEVDEFSDDVFTPEEMKLQNDQRMSSIKGQIDASNDEYQRFGFIQKTLNRFYLSDQCRGRFVETVCIAESEQKGEELKRYLEEELFLNVLVRKINLCEGINALARLEEEAL